MLTNRKIKNRKIKNRKIKNKKFYNFLNEIKYNIDDIIDLIKSNCQIFLNEMKSFKNADIWLYRGIQTTNLYSIEKFPKNRKSLDTSIYTHHELNIGFKKVFNNPIRSNSLFCTGLLHTAIHYGNKYIIFPYDKYEIYWSPKIKDLRTFISANDIIKNTDIINYPDHVKAFLYTNTFSFDNSQLSEVLKALENQLNLDSNKSQDFNIDILNKKYPNLSEQFVKYFYTKGNLQKALKSDNEIMLTGNKYIYISYDIWKEKQIINQIY